MSMKYESHLAGSCGGGGFLYNAYVEKFMNVAGMLEREREMNCVVYCARLVCGVGVFKNEYFLKYLYHTKEKCLSKNPFALFF